MLAAFIDTLTAIDVHAHPLRYVAAGTPADSEYDALPLDGLPPFPMPWGVRADHPQYRDAQVALFHVSATDTGATYTKALSEARKRVITEQGDKYGGWVLAQAHIGTMLANRVAMGAGLPATAFKWVPFADALMLPLDGAFEATRTPDTKSLYPLETKLLNRYLRDLSLTGVPATLDAFESQVVVPTLERQRAGGAVGIKFEAAYLRTLDFGVDDANAARTIYARYAKGGTPSHADYLTLQNHLFRTITRTAGKLGLAVQIHSLEAFGGYYSPEGAAPHQLESVFNDTTLRATTFVIVHGGWPRVAETMALLGKPNVYADISMMDVLAEPAALAQTLRTWLADAPEKVLFGTDAFDGGDAQGWEQIAWVASRNARRALTTALDGMVHDGQISHDRAMTLARMVLRDNAHAAYHLDGK